MTEIETAEEEEEEEEEAEEDTEATDRCTRQFALTVALIARYPSNLLRADQYIAGTASVRGDLHVRKEYEE